MTTDLQIAQGMLAACLREGHKPGKVQFTKYLYLLDYLHCHFTGDRASHLPWRFYHYGPWCEEVETCMVTLANQYSFQWWEQEASILRSLEMPEPPLDLTAKTLIAHVIGLFKDRDLNVLLDVTYSQTEPMAKAQRGDVLDFSSIPLDKRIPDFFPKAGRRIGSYTVPEQRRKAMEAFRERTESLRVKARQRMTWRASSEYQQAIMHIAEELGDYTALPQMAGAIAVAAAQGLGSPEP
jgi:hypothetical protein